MSQCPTLSPSGQFAQLLVVALFPGLEVGKVDRSIRELCG